ncbi:hypothetical protein OPIT5_00680 [Opitutaceae bacterium TAV5]|nr:hypothetical protein OPIT5_00680 [Opitutaceae bacterium TAV5]
MKFYILGIIGALFLCSCATTPKEQEIMGPLAWTSNRDESGGYLGEDQIISLALGHIKDISISHDEIPKENIKIFYPDVLPQDIDKFPMIMVIIPLRITRGETYDMAETRQIIINNSGKILISNPATMEIRNTLRHGAPW